MKTIRIIAICASVFCAFSASAKKIVIHMSGSADGIHYKTVNEVHTWFKDKLSCIGEGNTTCAWYGGAPILAGSSGQHSADEFQALAMDAIKSGKISGSITIDGILVEWNTAGENRFITITDING